MLIAQNVRQHAKKSMQMDKLSMTKEINDWQYSAIIDLSVNKMELTIIPKVKIPIPDRLVKYYGLKNHNIDSVTNNYLYASHPFDLNDPFDCFSKLISFDNIPLDMCIRFMSLFQMPKETVEELYNNERQKLYENIKNLFYDYTYSKLGIISMTSDSIDMQMWTYYSEHKGFLISFKTENLKKQLHGPFPINYTKNANSIEFSDNVFIAALYQTNVKSDSWVKENEWRFLYESFEPMKLPNIKELRDQQKERRFVYNKSDIEEIVLGFLFFDPDCVINYSNDIATYDFTKSKNKIEIIGLLEYLVKNSDLNISLIHLQNDLNYRLTKRKISVSKIKDNIYSYKRIE
jgi:hypothetical protein